MLYGGIREVKEKTRSALFFRGMGDFPHVSGLIQYWHLILIMPLDAEEVNIMLLLGSLIKSFVLVATVILILHTNAFAQIALLG